MFGNSRNIFLPNNNGVNPMVYQTNPSIPAPAQNPVNVNFGPTPGGNIGAVVNHQSGAQVYGGVHPQGGYGAGASMTFRF